MAATVNGLSLSKLRPFGATFFIFSDYARPAIRLSALMELPTIFIFTHDAMGDGEDGPTHQPVEQLLSLRAIPGLVTLRPGDANEVVEAYRYVMQLRHQPAVLVLSRQPLPTLDRSRYAPASGVARGAYVLADAPVHSDLRALADLHVLDQLVVLGRQELGERFGGLVHGATPFGSQACVEDTRFRIQGKPICWGVGAIDRQRDDI